jgi:transposase
MFLPPYRPDLNLIEMAFAKLKANLRAMAMRTIDELWKAAGQICDLFTSEECAATFKLRGMDSPERPMLRYRISRM